MGSGKLIIKAQKKYGIENFEKTYITIAMTQEEANALEQFYIAEERAKGKAEYNIADGGVNGGNLYKRTAEHIEYRRQKAIGNQWHKGHSQSDYCKKRVSEANKGHIPWNKGTAGKGVMKAWNKGDTGRLHWYNNGIKSVMAEKCPEGYVPGRGLFYGNKEDK